MEYFDKKVKWKYNQFLGVCMSAKLHFLTVRKRNNIIKTEVFQKTLIYGNKKISDSGTSYQHPVYIPSFSE